MIMAVRFGLVALLPLVERSFDDPARFWEIDVEVCISRFARVAARALRSGRAQPAFPDWVAVSVNAGRPAFEAKRASLLRLASIEELGLPPAAFPYEVFGVLMETGIAEGTFTLVCLADGTANLHMSDGGGTIGAGTHEVVRIAAGKLLAVAQDFWRDASALALFPTPALGRVTFYFLTREGVRRHDAGEAELEQGLDPFFPVFDAGHELLGEVLKLDLASSSEPE
ncbi:hypothetical protein ACNOYE_34340 [Nannocystaceae bacterium ST9]